MLSNVENELNIAIRDEEFEKIVKFLNINVERINDFFYFYDNDEYQMSYFDKTIYKD